MTCYILRIVLVVSSCICVHICNPFYLTIDIIHDRLELLLYIEKSTKRIQENDCYQKLEKLRMQRIYQVSKFLPDNDIVEKRNTFIQFIEEYDRRKKTDFLSTFPEMESFYYDCFKLK